MAGWQDSLHGLSKEEIAQARVRNTFNNLASGGVSTAQADAIGSALSVVNDFQSTLVQLRSGADLIAFHSYMASRIPEGSTGYFNLYFNKYTGALTHYTTPTAQILVETDLYRVMPFSVEGKNPLIKQTEPVCKAP